jgi:hypothetical protein
MADAKVTALNELLEAAGSDLVYIVDDPAGSPEGKKITLANLVASFLEYGGLYTDDGIVTQSGITTTPEKLTLFANNGESSANVTPDHTNDQITLADAGKYLLFCQLAFSGTANATFKMHARLDGVQQNEAGSRRKLGGSGDVGSMSFLGILSVTAGQVLTVFVQTTTGSADLTLVEGQLVILRVS